MADKENLKDWLELAMKEIKQLESKGYWSEVSKSEVPKGELIIPNTWFFRYKQNLAGEILKCKVRICLRGDLMHDNAKSYAPVVAWSTI